VRRKEKRGVMVEDEEGREGPREEGVRERLRSANLMSSSGWGKRREEEEGEERERERRR